MASRETLVVEPGTGAATSIRRLRPSGRWRQFRRHRLASIGLMMLTLIVLMVTVGPLLYPHKIDDIDLLARLKPPSLAHPMGTDDLGRDLMARVLIGWELGTNRGHVDAVLRIARHLLSNGHDVHLALQQIDGAPLDADPRLHIWQAPIWPR